MYLSIMETGLVILLIVLPIYILLCWLVAMMAAEKGNSKTHAFLLSVTKTPFVGLVEILLQSEQKIDYTTKPFVCTFCGTGLNKLYEYCPSCGRGLHLKPPNKKTKSDNVNKHNI